MFCSKLWKRGCLLIRKKRHMARLKIVLSTASSHPVEGHIKPPGTGSQATLLSMANDWNQNMFVVAQCNCSHNKFILFPAGNSGKESTRQCRRCDPGSGRSSGGGNGNPLQYACMENTMDRGAWYARVHRVTKSHTQLKYLKCTNAFSCQVFLFLWLKWIDWPIWYNQNQLASFWLKHLVASNRNTSKQRFFSPREKESGPGKWMGLVSPWRIPWIEEPGGLQRVEPDWAINTYTRENKKCYGSNDKTCGETLVNPPRSPHSSEQQGLCGEVWAAVGAVRGPWRACNHCGAARILWLKLKNWGHPSGRCCLCKSRVLLHLIPTPLGSLRKPLGTGNMEMALHNLGCFRYQVSLLNQVEDYYRNCVIEDLRESGGIAQYLEKLLKLQCWGYKHEACFLHD